MSLRDKTVTIVRTWWTGGGLPPWLHLAIGFVAPAVLMTVNMIKVRAFTVDDAYISFRYARNLVDGHGLVYNAGELIEGYTNFSWTLAMAAGMAAGIDPHVLSKVLGAAAAVVMLYAVYRIADRLAPLRTLPCVATWLLATSATQTCWAMFGMETSAFTMLVVLGTLLMMREQDRGRGFVASGLVFALAGLTRPEAPMYLGLPMLMLGRGFLSRQNIMRGIVFVLPLALHAVWRHSYYGAWLPATLEAKTGDLAWQLSRGTKYVRNWSEHAGPWVWLGLYGAALGVMRRRREVVALALVAAVGLGYVVLVGGDWMSYFRFVAPLEPYVCLLVGLAVGTIVETRDRAAILALALFSVWVGRERQRELREATKNFVRTEKRHWDNGAGRAAEWIADNLPPGRIALGDIGYVGWRTNYPILDLLGLVDPVISDLPGGYTKKIGEGYIERFYELQPEYAVLIMTDAECDSAAFKGVAVLTDDPRFRPYEVRHVVSMPSGAWCIFVRR